MKSVLAALTDEKKMIRFRHFVADSDDKELIEKAVCDYFGTGGIDDMPNEMGITLISVTIEDVKPGDKETVFDKLPIRVENSSGTHILSKRTCYKHDTLHLDFSRKKA